MQGRWTNWVRLPTRCCETQCFDASALRATAGAASPEIIPLYAFCDPQCSYGALGLLLSDARGLHYLIERRVSSVADVICYCRRICFSGLTAYDEHSQRIGFGAVSVSV